MAQNLSLAFFHGLVLASVLLTNARDSPQETLASNWDLRIELTINKRMVLAREPVRYRVILRNSGKSHVYVAKRFFAAGGGIAGFYVDIKQLTGKQSRCSGFAADAFAFRDTREPEQILREDYLLLPPGGIIGFESEDDCQRHSGTYQINATYVSQNLNIDKVRLLADKADAIVVGRFCSEPLTFRVRDRH